ncbi:MAG: hypothetical protein HFACDABA_01914 [Anaerolineales bacterium]|nr:hypothetical protein [Anaerolineales bacterium]
MNQPRPRAKRFLGMTANQLILLGGILVFLCCVLAGGMGLLNLLVGTVYAPVMSSIDLPTPPASPTAAPTLPPTGTPAPTEIPYEALIPPDWKQFTLPEAPGMEFWLPGTYKTLSGKEKDNSSPAPLYGPNVDDMKMLMVLVDSKESMLLLYTNAFVSVVPMRGDFDETMDVVFGALLRRGRPVEQREIEVSGLPAQKLVIDINFNGVNAGIVVYTFQRGGELWQFGFITPYNELFARMEEFDAAARTFRLRPVTPTPTITPTVPPPTNTRLP